MKFCRRTGLIEFGRADMLNWGVSLRRVEAAEGDNLTLLDFLSLPNTKADLASVLRNVLTPVEARRAALTYYEWLAEIVEGMPESLAKALQGEGNLEEAVAAAGQWYKRCGWVKDDMRAAQWRMSVLRAARAEGRRRLRRNQL